MWSGLVFFLKLLGGGLLMLGFAIVVVFGFAVLEAVL